MLEQDGYRSILLAAIPVGVAALPLVPGTFSGFRHGSGRAARTVASASYSCAIVILAWIMALLMVTLIGFAYAPSLIVEILAFKRHLGVS
jgi:hypothetical protein